MASRDNLPAVRSDASLLRELRGGANEAATQLFLRYAQRLQKLADVSISSNLARRVDADDVVQSVFRTFFRRAAAGEYEVPAGEDLWNLFLVIALNKVREGARQHHAAKRDVRKTADIEKLPIPPAFDEDGLRVLHQTIDEILAPLPESQREIVRLRIAGHEVTEIAAATQRAKRSVERILHEFRTALSAAIHEG